MRFGGNCLVAIQLGMGSLFQWVTSLLSYTRLHLDCASSICSILPTVLLLTQGKEWREALRVAYSNGRPDLVDTLVAPQAALAAAAALEGERGLWLDSLKRWRSMDFGWRAGLLQVIGAEHSLSANVLSYMLYTSDSICRHQREHRARGQVRAAAGAAARAAGGDGGEGRTSRTAFLQLLRCLEKSEVPACSIALLRFFLLQMLLSVWPALQAALEAAAVESGLPSRQQPEDLFDDTGGSCRTQLCLTATLTSCTGTHACQPGLQAWPCRMVPHTG